MKTTFRQRVVPGVMNEVLRNGSHLGNRGWPLAIFCVCTARFVLDPVENPEDRFSHNEAHLILHVRL